VSSAILRDGAPIDPVEEDLVAHLLSLVRKCKGRGIFQVTLRPGYLAQVGRLRQEVEVPLRPFGLRPDKQGEIRHG
jgi:hypothetical protein